MSNTLFLLLLSLFSLLHQATCAPFDIEPPSIDTPDPTLSQEEASLQPAQVDFTIHESCNVTQAATLHHAFSELQSVAKNASSYIERNGSEDPLFVMYFGKGADQSIPMGYYDSIAKGDNSQLIFRCDDSDGQCRLHKDWNGHWRGARAKDETVICDLSFNTRLWLDKLCRPGVTNINSYWAFDLIHRSLHMPAIGQDVAEHASKYSDILRLAQGHPENAVRNMNTLQSFAFEAVSRSPQRPQGCMAQMKE